MTHLFLSFFLLDVYPAAPSPSPQTQNSFVTLDKSRHCRHARLKAGRSITADDISHKYRMAALAGVRRCCCCCFPPSLCSKTTSDALVAYNVDPEIGGHRTYNKREKQ